MEFKNLTTEAFNEFVKGKYQELSSCGICRLQCILTEDSEKQQGS